MALSTCPCRKFHPAWIRIARQGASCDGWSSITPRRTQVGSTWSRSRSECCAANASTDASTARSSSKPRSRPGNVSAMPQAPASNGCSQPTRPAPKCAGPTHSPLPYARAKPKGQNHCAAVLAVKPQEVIPGQTESANRRFACEANMRPVPVVAMEPSGQRGEREILSRVSPVICPLS
jgi:hypothetical protein